LGGTPRVVTRMFQEKGIQKAEKVRSINTTKETNMKMSAPEGGRPVKETGPSTRWQNCKERQFSAERPPSAGWMACKACGAGNKRFANALQGPVTAYGFCGSKVILKERGGCPDAIQTALVSTETKNACFFVTAGFARDKRKKSQGGRSNNKTRDIVSEFRGEADKRSYRKGNPLATALATTALPRRKPGRRKE